MVQQQSSFEQHNLEKKLAMLDKEENMMQESYEKSKENYLMQLKANEAQKSLKQKIEEKQVHINELKQKDLDILKKVE